MVVQKLSISDKVAIVEGQGPDDPPVVAAGAGRTGAEVVGVHVHLSGSTINNEHGEKKNRPRPNGESPTDERREAAQEGPKGTRAD